MKKLVIATAIFGMTAGAVFAEGHSAASEKGVEASNGKAESTPDGFGNGVEKSGGKAGNATNKPGQNKE